MEGQQFLMEFIRQLKLSGNSGNDFFESFYGEFRIH